MIHEQSSKTFTYICELSLNVNSAYFTEKSFTHGCECLVQGFHLLWASCTADWLLTPNWCVALCCMKPQGFQPFLSFTSHKNTAHSAGRFEVRLEFTTHSVSWAKFFTLCHSKSSVFIHIREHFRHSIRHLLWKEKVTYQTSRGHHIKSDPLPPPAYWADFLCSKAQKDFQSMRGHIWTPVNTCCLRSIVVAGGEAQICGLGIGLKLCRRVPVGCWSLWVISGCQRLHALQKYFVSAGLHTLFFERSIAMYL